MIFVFSYTLGLKVQTNFNLKLALWKEIVYNSVLKYNTLKHALKERGE